MRHELTFHVLRLTFVGASLNVDLAIRNPNPDPNPIYKAEDEKACRKSRGVWRRRHERRLANTDENENADLRRCFADFH